MHEHITQATWPFYRATGAQFTLVCPPLVCTEPPPLKGLTPMNI
jgi:hypothetical protein